MSLRPRSPPASGAFSRRFTAYAGIYFDEFDSNSAWIREKARLRLPPLEGVHGLIVRGEVRVHPEARGLETAAPGLRLFVNGQSAAGLAAGTAGPWELRVTLPRAETITLSIEITGVVLTNFHLAWPVDGSWRLAAFPAQGKNTSSAPPDRDGGRRDHLRSPAAALSHRITRAARQTRPIIGFLTAELSVGESARCMVRAADAPDRRRWCRSS
jgi:hypothetical protein